MCISKIAFFVLQKIFPYYLDCRAQNSKRLELSYDALHISVLQDITFFAILLFQIFEFNDLQLNSSLRCRKECVVPHLKDPNFNTFKPYYPGNGSSFRVCHELLKMLVYLVKCLRILNSFFITSSRFSSIKDLTNYG